MITASTSSRLTAEAIPAPSASTARSISSVASVSSCSSACPQTELVSRVRPRCFMSLNRSVLAPLSTSRRARASIAARPA